jgi:hypothetical protein
MTHISSPMNDRNPKSVPEHRVSLTGLNSPTFGKAMEVILGIEETFKREIGEQNMDDWIPDLSGDYIAMAFTTRIASLAPRNSNTTHLDSEVEIPDGFDPNGIIRKSERLTFLRENRIELIDCSEGMSRRAKPNNFKQGDIVELEASFIAIPLAGARFRLKLVMRALTLLDKSFSRVSSKTKS